MEMWLAGTSRMTDCLVYFMMYVADRSMIIVRFTIDEGG
jgi:hypothetical protein